MSLFRIAPQAPVHAYKTFEILAPKQTHFKVVACEDADCAVAASGWVTAVDETSALGQRQAHYIRRESRRAFKEEKREDGRTAFVFAPGQDCFQEHRVRVDRPEFYVVRGGDHRGNPLRERREHDRPEHWVEDFAEHQDRIATRVSG